MENHPSRNRKQNSISFVYKNLVKSGLLVLLLDIYGWNLKVVSRDLWMHFVVDTQCMNESEWDISLITVLYEWIPVMLFIFTPKGIFEWNRTRLNGNIMSHSFEQDKNRQKSNLVHVWHAGWAANNPYAERQYAVS